MGAGSSATAAEIDSQIKDASQEDVNAAVAGLSAEKRTQLLATLKGAAPSAPETSSKEADVGEAATAGVGSEAPFLHQAFKLITEAFKDAMIKGMSGEANVNPEELEQEMERTLTKAKELMGKSFDHHDKSANGVLDKVEAAAFFKHLLEEQGGLMEHIIEVGVRKSTELMIKEMKKCTDVPEGENADMIKAMKASVNETLAESKKMIEDSLGGYKANKEERDAAAFKLVDTAGNGTLSKDEFLDAMTFGSEKNAKVFEALGIAL